MSLPRPSALPFVRVRARALSAVACLLVVLGGLTPGGGLATARAQSLPLPLQQTLTGGYPFGSAVAVDGDEAPRACPACAHPQAHFELLAENW